VRSYYFGCVGDVGHYMHTPDLESDWDFLRHNPWGVEIDDGFKGLQHKEGWTALAMVDYTVDSRPGSNSVFLAEGTYSLNEMIEIAKRDFPSISERINIERLRDESHKS
jgi:hypothetical protein